MKRVVICADDFGQDRAIDAGILRLAGAGRVTAVSCLAEGLAFAADAPALLATPASPGLHLELTEGPGGGAPSALGPLVLRAGAGALDRARLARRIAAQLDAFERIAGRPPAFVDGHRHVHQLPGVRALLLDALEARWPGRRPLLRVTVPARFRGAKAALVGALGGRGLARLLARRGFPSCADFAGVYAFDDAADYRALARGWLASLRDGGLLMCHPGEPGGAPTDPIGRTRARELAYLAGPAFEEDCAAAGVVRVPVEERAGGRGG